MSEMSEMSEKKREKPNKSEELIINKSEDKTNRQKTKIPMSENRSTYFASQNIVQSKRPGRLTYFFKIIFPMIFGFYLGLTLSQDEKNDIDFSVIYGNFLIGSLVTVGFIYGLFDVLETKKSYDTMEKLEKQQIGDLNKLAKEYQSRVEALEKKVGELENYNDPRISDQTIRQI